MLLTDIAKIHVRVYANCAFETLCGVPDKECPPNEKMYGLKAIVSASSLAQEKLCPDCENHPEFGMLLLDALHYNSITKKNRR